MRKYVVILLFIATISPCWSQRDTLSFEGEYLKVSSSGWKEGVLVTKNDTLFIKVNIDTSIIQLVRGKHVPLELWGMQYFSLDAFKREFIGKDIPSHERLKQGSPKLLLAGCFSKELQPFGLNESFIIWTGETRFYRGNRKNILEDPNPKDPDRQLDFSLLVPVWYKKK